VKKEEHLQMGIVAVKAIANAGIGLAVGVIAVLLLKMAHAGFWMSSAVLAGGFAAIALWEYLSEQALRMIPLLMVSDRTKMNGITSRMHEQSRMPAYTMTLGCAVGVITALTVPLKALSSFLGML